MIFVIESTLRYLQSRAPTLFLNLIEFDDRMCVYACGRTMTQKSPEGPLILSILFRAGRGANRREFNI
jgi:hypothetical protein